MFNPDSGLRMDRQFDKRQSKEEVSNKLVQMADDIHQEASSKMSDKFDRSNLSNNSKEDISAYVAEGFKQLEALRARLGLS